MNSNEILKLRTLTLAKILYERTDEDHFLTTPQLIEILDKEYGIPAYRTTIAKDVEILQAFGLDVQVVRAHQIRYNLLGREFDNAEIKLLIDAVASSKFISKKKSETLTAKLATLAGKNKAEELKRNISVERRIKTDNEKVLFIIDAVNDAINQGKKIRFQYFEYNVKKERKPRMDGYFYRISPYRLVWNGDYYYVVGCKDKYTTLSSYRIDRMVSTPEIMDEDAAPLPKDFDMDHYLNTMYHMFSTERKHVQLVCTNDVMDAVIDRFGEDVETYAFDMEHFRADVEVAVNSLFYMWIFGFRGKVSIKEPQDVKDGYIQMVKDAYEKLVDLKDANKNMGNSSEDIPF